MEKVGKGVRRLQEIDKKQASLSVGVLFALMHFVWLLAVLVGLARGWVDLALGYHFVSKSYEILSFNLVTGLIGLVAAFVCGYVTGWVFAYIWNWAGER